MRHAPPVSVRCLGGWPWRVVQTGLPALATGVVVLWLAQRLEQSDVALGQLVRWFSVLGLGLGDVGANANQSAAPEALSAALALIMSLIVAAAAWRLARPRACDLTWDGLRWSANGAAGRVAVMVDLGPWLLLRWWPEAGSNRAPRWLAISGSEAAGAWHALRAALYSRALPDAPAPSNRNPHPNAHRQADGQP